MTDLHIPDLSKWQRDKDIDFSRIGPVVILRAHNGHGVDPTLKRRQVLARRYCKVVLYYGFMVKDRDPAVQAHEMAAAVGPLRKGEAFICDAEEGVGNQTPRVLKYLGALGGRDIYYSGLAFSQAHLKGIPKGVLFWEAAYRSVEPHGDAHFLWQYTDKGRVPGVKVPVDVSVFHGTLGQLEALINPPAKAAPAPAKKPAPVKKAPAPAPKASPAPSKPSPAPSKPAPPTAAECGGLDPAQVRKLRLHTKWWKLIMRWLGAKTR